MALIRGQHIPGELIDAIVDHLFDDRPSLKTCSLISRAFTSPSQRRLFHRFSLFVFDYNLIANVAERFQKLLEALSIQFGYIQVLQLRIQKCGQSLPALISILDRLVNLKELRIRGHKNRSIDERLVYHCCKPTITRLYIGWTFDFPSHYLRRCISLRELVVEYAVLSIPDDAKASIPELASLPPVPITSLTFEHARECVDASIADWIESPRCPIDVRDLTSLSLLPNDVYEFEMIYPILHKFSDSLKSLFINPPNAMWLAPGDGQIIPSVDLALLSYLNHFSFSIYESGEVDNLYFRWFMSELSTIPTSNSLESLQIVLKVLHENPSEIILSVMDERWRELDEALAQTKLAGIQDVQVLLDADYLEGTDWRMWVSWVQDVMRETKEHKSLLITVTSGES